jgi:hypothetical protein
MPQTQSGFDLVPVDSIDSLGNGSRPGFIIEIKQHRGSQTRTFAGRLHAVRNVILNLLDCFDPQRLVVTDTILRM